jgi:hypothetical protein
MLCSTNGSRFPKNISTPMGWRMGRPDRDESQRQSSSDSQAMRVYTSSAP